MFDQYFLFRFQDLQHFFETSQKLQKQLQAQVFLVLLLSMKLTFTYILTEILVQVISMHICIMYVCISITYNFIQQYVCMALTKLEMNTAVTSWKQMNAYQFPESGCCHACLCMTRYISCVYLYRTSETTQLLKKLSDDKLSRFFFVFYQNVTVINDLGLLFFTHF